MESLTDREKSDKAAQTSVTSASIRSHARCASPTLLAPLHRARHVADDIGDGDRPQILSHDPRSITQHFQVTLNDVQIRHELSFARRQAPPPARHAPTLAKMFTALHTALRIRGRRAIHITQPGPRPHARNDTRARSRGVCPARATTPRSRTWRGYAADRRPGP